MWDVSNGLREALGLIKKFNNHFEFNQFAAHLLQQTPQNIAARRADNSSRLLTKGRMLQSVPIVLGLNETPCQEGLSRGVKFMLETSTIPIWVVFAFQVAIDTEKELLPSHKTKHAPQSNDLLHIAEIRDHRNSKLQEYDDIDFKELKSNPHVEYAESMIQQTNDDVAGITYKRAAMSYLSAASPLRSHPVFTIPDTFLQGNPIRAGMVKYSTYIPAHMAAARLEQEQFSILPLIHVYNAGRLAFPDDPIWPDMEYLLQNQNEDHLFVGGRPKTIDEGRRKWLLALGCSPSNLARNRRQNAQIKVDQKKVRWLQNSNVLDEHFFTWLHGFELKTSDQALQSSGSPDPMPRMDEDFGLRRKGS